MQNFTPIGAMHRRQDMGNWTEKNNNNQYTLP